MAGEPETLEYSTGLSGHGEGEWAFVPFGLKSATTVELFWPIKGTIGAAWLHRLLVKMSKRGGA